MLHQDIKTWKGFTRHWIIYRILSYALLHIINNSFFNIQYIVTERLSFKVTSLNVSSPASPTVRWCRPRFSWQWSLTLDQHRGILCKKQQRNVLLDFVLWVWIWSECPGVGSWLYLRSRWWAPSGMLRAISDELSDLRTWTAESRLTPPTAHCDITAPWSLLSGFDALPPRWPTGPGLHWRRWCCWLWRGLSTTATFMRIMETNVETSFTPVLKIRLVSKHLEKHMNHCWSDHKGEMYMLLFKLFLDLCACHMTRIRIYP